MGQFVDIRDILSKNEGLSVEDSAEQPVENETESEPQAAVEEPAKEEVVEQPVAEEVVEEKVEDKVVEDVIPEQPVEKKPKTEKKPEEKEESKLDISEEELNTLKTFRDKIENDEFLKNLIDYYERTGDVKPYLNSQGINYEKDYNDEQILRLQFDQENADLTKTVRDKLFAKEMKAKYGFDTDGGDFIDVEDVELTQALMKRDAVKARNKFIEEQKQFQIPEPKPPVDKVAEPDTKAAEEAKAKAEAAEKAQKEELEKFYKFVDDHETFKSIKETKMVKIDAEGVDEQFGYEVIDPDSIAEMVKDERKFFQMFKGQDGVDWDRISKVYAYAQDTKAFESALIDFGRTLEREAYLKEAKNTDGLVRGTGGKDAPVDERLALLNAFLEKKRSQKGG